MDKQNSKSGHSLAVLTIVCIFVLSSCVKPAGQNAGVNQTGAGTKTPVAASSPTPTLAPTPQPKERITLGEQALLYGDYDTAINQFWKARETSLDPEVIATAQLGVGRVLMIKGDYQGAITQFQWLQSNFSEGTPRNTAYFFLAKAYENLKQYAQAAESYRNYRESQPSTLDSEIAEMEGDAWLNAGDAASAKAAYLKAIESAADSQKDGLSLKIARASAAAGDTSDAITRYLALYDSAADDYIKSQANFLLGQTYLNMGLPEQAYSRFQDSIARFPAYYDTYSGLVALVEAGQPVNELFRGIVDYNAGQYGLAAAALDRYMNTYPDHDGTPHYYKALSLWQMADYAGEVAEWNKLIRDHPTDQHLAQAYLEKSSTQWRYLEDYLNSAATLLEFVARIPDSPKAAEYLYTAAEIYEIGGYLTKAAKTWQRVFNEYPGATQAYQAFFKSGIVNYRLQKYPDAQIIFQRALVLSTTPEDSAAANFWTAKCLEEQGKTADSNKYYQQASDADPGGYYSLRAAEILAGQKPFQEDERADFSINLENEKSKADEWMRSTFSLDDTVDLSSPGALADNPAFARGEAWWNLGMRDQARAEFEAFRQELKGNGPDTYRLMNHMLELGFYQTAALSSRQVLDQAGLSQAATITDAPKYFNHIRFGTFYRDLVLDAANENNLDPLLLFSLIRQESLFDASISSSAGAKGLMQITEETGDFIVYSYGWPPNYTSDDLDRPVVNIRLGAYYLKSFIEKYNGDVIAALSSYNAGDGNTIEWRRLSGNDPDLFLEIIRFDETYNYIQYIAENYAIYQNLYTHP